MHFTVVGARLAEEKIFMFSHYLAAEYVI